jgi:Domain of unknown function (DUF4349)
MSDVHRNWKEATVIVVILVLALASGLVVFGGQTSTILSKVGAAIGDNPGRDTTGGDTTGGDETPVDEGKNIADAAARPPDLLIIRTGKVEIEVTDLAAAVAAARTRILAVGGYVSASDESTSGDNATAMAVYRIPADRWDAALDGIRGLATKVQQLQVETEAVTSQVVDLGARITNLRASEAALQKIMAQATKISDVLDVQGELTKVREEIERLVAEKTLLEERAAFGTLTVVYNLPATPATEEVRRGWDPAVDADRATGTLISLGQAAASTAIWLGIVGLPLAIVVAIVVGLAWRVGRFVAKRGAVEPGTY